MKMGNRVISLLMSAAMVWNNAGPSLAEGYRYVAAQGEQAYTASETSDASQQDDAALGAQDEVTTTDAEQNAAPSQESGGSVSSNGNAEVVPSADSQSTSTNVDASTDSASVIPETSSSDSSTPGEDSAAGTGGDQSVVDEDTSASSSVPAETTDNTGTDGTTDAGGTASTTPTTDTTTPTQDVTTTTEVAPVEPAPAQEHTIESTLNLVDGGTYKLSITYGDEAGIPEGASLVLHEYNQVPEHYGDPDPKYVEQFKNRPTATETFLTKEDFEARLGLVAKGLAMEEGLDRAYYTKLIQADLVDANGQAIKLNSNLKVTIETNAIDILDAPAVEVGYFNPEYDASRMKPEEAVRPIETKNVTENKSREDFDRDTEHPLRTKVELATDHLGTLAVACVARAKATWEQGDERVVLQAARSLETTAEEWGDPGELGDGIETYGAWWVRFAEEPAYGARAWLTTSSIKDAEKRAEGTGYAAWRLSEPEGQLFGAAGAASPVALEPGDVFALGWDTGVRTEEATAPDATSAGDATSTTSAAEPTDTTTPAEGTATSQDGTSSQTSEPATDTTAETEPEPETNAVVIPEPEKLEEFVSYEQKYLASDGKTYRVTAGVPADAGVSAGAVLKVSEIAQGSRDYFDYVSASASELGVEHSDVTFALVLDISFVNPVTGEGYEPTKPVSVTIDLLAEKLAGNQDTNVVHFGDTTEVVEATKEGDAVAFEAESFSVYVVMQVAKQVVLTAGNGQTYEISVRYDTASGIPENATLQVTELASDDPQFDAYMEKAADALKRESGRLDFTRAFDISLVNPTTGERYQPTKNVKVSIRLLGESVEKGDGINVVHFPSTNAGEDVLSILNSSPEVLTNAVQQDGTVEFETDSFSVYIVDKDALTKRFVFLNNYDDGMTADNRDEYVFAEQVLIDGESLVEPPMPFKEGAVFDKWVVEGTDEKATFPQVVSINPDQIAGDDHDEKQATLDAQTTYYLATYQPATVLVTFYNQSGIVVSRKAVDRPTGTATETLDTNEVNYLAIQDKENTIITFDYWTDDANGQGGKCGTNGDGILKIEASSPSEISLYPHLSEGHYLFLENNKDTFGIDSATYIGPEMVINTSGTSDAEIAAKAQAVCDSLNSRDNHAIPTAKGYEFTGWFINSADAAGETSTPVFAPTADGTALTVNWAEYKKLLGPFGNLSSNATLYAHWKEKESSTYTVVIWTQKLNADGTAAMEPDGDVKLEDCYSFQKSFTLTANTGSTKNMEAVNADVKSYLNLPQTQNCDLTNLYDLTMYNSIYRVNESDKEKNPYYGFTYSDANSDTGITVKSDGSAVMNIRYDRNVHSLVFGIIKYNKNNSGEYGIYDGYHYNGNTLSNGYYFKLYMGNSQAYYFTFSAPGYGQINYTGDIYIRTWVPFSGYRYSKVTSYDENQNYYGDLGEDYTQLTKRNYNGDRYNRRFDIVKSADKVFGAKIVDEFAFTGSDGESYRGVSWLPSGDGDKKYKVELMALQSMPDESYTFTYNKTGQGKYMHYFVEASGADDEAGKPTRSFPANGNDSKVYIEYCNPIEHGYPILLFTEDVTDIDGYVKDHEKSEPAFIWNDQYGGWGLTPTENSYFYYDRETYHIYYYNPQGSGGTSSYVNDDEVKFKAPVGAYTNAYTPQRPSENHRFAGWYMDPECKTKAFFDKASYDAAVLDEGESKELIETMPSRNILLYAKWTIVKNRALVIPNGGELAGEENKPAHLDPGEKISLADPSRDYLYVGSGEGKYNYDAVNGTYSLDENEQGDYEQSIGAYRFQGWYEAVLDNPGEKKIVEYRPGNYTYAYGEYVEAPGGNGQYDLVDGTYVYNAQDTGAYNFVNAQPKKDNHGSYVLGNRFNANSAPTGPVTLIAVWQRAGGFLVQYDIKDTEHNIPDADYKGIAAPEDDYEYIDGSFAVAQPAFSAPRGYTLDCWVDKNGDTYRPNELVAITESNANPDSSGNYMIVTLRARYRVFDPSERNMADYIFLTNVDKDNLSFTENYETYEVQRIAVNEELKAPLEPPTPEGYIFRGWYYDKAGTRKFDGFGIIANPLNTRLYAVYDKALTVTYYLTKVSKDANGQTTYEPSNIVLATQVYRETSAGQYEQLDTRRITHPVDVDHYVVSWHERGNTGKKYPYNGISSDMVTGPLKLDADLVERKYCVFDSRGGSYVGKQEITDNGWPYPPEEPKREGYNFVGWFSEKRGGTKYNFTEKLSDFFNKEQSEYTLYAHWETDGTPQGKLRVIFWAQTADRPDNIDDALADYQSYQMIDSVEMPYRYGDYTSEELKTAALGDYVDSGQYSIAKTTNKAYNGGNGSASAVAFVKDVLGYKGNNSQVTEALWNAGGRIDDLQYYYAFNPLKSDDEVSVDSNDNGVLNIRFDLKTYTLKFTHDNKVKIAYGDTTYPTDTGDCYTIPVWLNRPITNQWPTELTEQQQATGRAELTMNDQGAVFYGWQYSALVASKSGSTVTINEEQKTTRAPINMADKLIIDAARKTDNTLTFTPVIGDSLLTQNAYVHYLVREGDTTEFRELTDLTTTIKVPVKPEWVSYSLGTVTNYKQNSPDLTADGTGYLGFASSTCREHPNNHPGTKIGYTRLEPLGLSGYEQLENEHAHNGTLYNPDGTPSDDGGVSGKNMSPLYNLVLQGLARAQVIFDTGDPTYEAYFADHTNQYVEDAYNLYFYYKPIKYQLTFFSNPSDQHGESQMVYCGTSLTDIINSVGPPTPPEGQTVTFGGWALAPYQTHPDAQYTGDMPSHNFALYAIWEPYQYSVTTLGVDEHGGYFNANEDGNEIDEAGHLVPNGKKSAVYWINSGEELRTLNIPNPKHEGWLFLGWAEAESNASVSSVYRVRGNLVIKPRWESLTVRHITYDANVPQSLAGLFEGRNESPGAPTDGNEYIIGARAIIKSSGGMFIYRKDVTGEVYKADFAYWEDEEGLRYYPNTTYVFRENSPETLKLYAVYGEYRETSLLYDKNADAATFKYVENDQAYNTANMVPDENNTPNARVRVLYRDMLSKFWRDGTSKIPNEKFPVARDEEDKDFKVVREDDAYGNSYIFAGWAASYAEKGGREAKSASMPIAQNGDIAYVNTIKVKVKDQTTGEDVERLNNTFYAVWAICKVMDGKEEHLFESLRDAQTYINTYMGGTGTIQMLMDYNLPANDRLEVQSGENITISSAKTEDAAKAAGEKYWYGYQGAPTPGDKAMIKRHSSNTVSMFTVAAGGSLTTKDIVLDGGATFDETTHKPTSGSLVLQDATGGIVKSDGSLAIGEGTALQNAATKNSGSAIYSKSANATLTIQGTPQNHVTIRNCRANSKGGAVYYDVANSELTVKYCDVQYCSTSNGEGGAIEHWSDDTAAKTTVSNCTFDTCMSSEASNGSGGAVHSMAKELYVTNCTFSNCKSQKQGGAVQHYNKKGCLAAEYKNCTFTNCESTVDRSGGAIYTMATTSVLIEECLFDGCKAKKYGGGASVGHNENTAAQVTIRNSTFKNCSASEHGGGFYARCISVSVEGHYPNETGAFVSCTAKQCGGGIYVEDGVLTLDGCSVHGNTAAKGGGVYTAKKNVVLKNGATVTGNNLSGNTVTDAAGIYIDSGTLVLGDATKTDAETSQVKDNKTKNGTASNVRLKEADGINAPNSVSILSELGDTCKINVANAKDANKQFGSINNDGQAGMSVLTYDPESTTFKRIFEADDGVLFGCINPDDSAHKQVIWYGAVCKITDSNGYTLKYGESRDRDAVFMTLKEAFTVFKDEAKIDNPCYIKMLVDDFTLTPNGSIDASLFNAKRPVILTTEENTSTSASYPYLGTETLNGKTHATLSRAAGNTGLLFDVPAGCSLTIENITVDGMKRGVSSVDAGLINVTGFLTLSNNARLVNGKAQNGTSWSRAGAVYVSEGGSFVMTGTSSIEQCVGRSAGAVYVHNNATFTMEEDAKISGCTSTNEATGGDQGGCGGAVYVGRNSASTSTDQGGTFIQKGPSIIEDCVARYDGGAVYVEVGKYQLQGNATIKGCTAGRNGAGIYLTSKGVLEIQGSPTFGNGTEGNAANTVQIADYSSKKNGGAEVYADNKVRQDIYLTTTATPLPELVVTGEIGSGAGSIWVWADNAQHYESGMQFAILAEGATVTNDTFKAFRNAQDDEATKNPAASLSQPLYLTGWKGEDVGGKQTIIWKPNTSVAYKVIFKKVDEKGEPLPGAKLRLFDDGVSWHEHELAGYTDDDGNYESDSAGVFYIGQLPVGNYRLVETVFPEGYEPVAGYAGFDEDEPNTWWYYPVEVKEGGEVIVGQLTQRGQEPTPPQPPTPPEPEPDDDLVPVEGLVDDHSHGYLAWKELSTAVGQSINEQWVRRTDSNGVEYYALQQDNSGQGSWQYTVIYNPATKKYYKAVDNNGVDMFVTTLEYEHINNWDPVSFEVNHLGDGQSHYYPYINVEWVEVAAPKDIPESDSGPGTREAETDSTKWAYRADMWLNKYAQYFRSNAQSSSQKKVEWEPFRDGCMVFIQHNPGDEQFIALWYADKYYKAKTADGMDASRSPKLLWTNFSSADLLAGSGTYNGVEYKWVEIPDPYNEGTVAEGAPKEGTRVARTNSGDKAFDDIVGSTDYVWYRYRNGCMLAAFSNEDEWERSVPVIWYEGHSYRAAGVNQADNLLTIGNLNDGFYPEHLGDGKAHTYGIGQSAVTVTWTRID